VEPAATGNWRSTFTGIQNFTERINKNGDIVQTYYAVGVVRNQGSSGGDWVVKELGSFEKSGDQLVCYF